MDELDPKLLAIGGAIVLAALVGLSLLAKRTPAKLPPPPPVAAPPAPPPLPPTPTGASSAEAALLRTWGRIDPSELYPKAKARAIAWDRQAELFSLVARRVVGSGVDLSLDGAEIEYTFRILPRPAPLGQPEPPDQLRVTFARKAVTITEERTGLIGRLPPMEEPTCLFRDAMKNAIGSGVSEQSQVDARFEIDRSQKRSVWRIGHRMLDGKTCAVIQQR